MTNDDYNELSDAEKEAYDSSLNRIYDYCLESYVNSNRIPSLGSLKFLVPDERSAIPMAAVKRAGAIAGIIKFRAETRDEDERRSK